VAKKSAAALSISRPSRPGDLPPPPDTLDAAGRALWVEIVESKPADWFGPDSLPILEDYVQAVGMSRYLAGQVEKAKALGDGDVLKQYLDMRDKESRRAVSLATKMRLTQQSRYGARDAERADKKAKGARPWQAAS
jgi:hypothetical protein